MRCGGTADLGWCGWVEAGLLLQDSATQAQSEMQDAAFTRVRGCRLGYGKWGEMRLLAIALLLAGTPSCPD